MQPSFDYLSIHDLEIGRNLVDHNKDESCGVFEYDSNNELRINIQRPIISRDSKRKNCTHEKYSKIIYHTHPKKSKSYPSFEDIMKITKNKDDNSRMRDAHHNNKIIKTSLIFTDCGIWELYCNENKNLPHDTSKRLENSILQSLKKIYERYSGSIIYDDETGKIKDVKEGGRSVVNDEYLEKVIKRMEDLLHNHFPSYKMYFSEWNLNDEYQLHH